MPAIIHKNLFNTMMVIFIVIVLSFCAMIIRLKTEHKETQKALKKELESKDKQLDIATDQFLLLMNRHEQEIEVFENFKDSCLVLVKLNGKNTEIKIKNLINLTNEELYKIALQK